MTKPIDSTLSLGDAALKYAAEHGWPVFPVVERGKKPLTIPGLTIHGLNDATTDPDVIRRCWKTNPHANIGIATGPPGPTVIDCDGPIGKHNWMKLVDGIGWVGVPWSTTGGGGWHIYYAGDPEIRNRVGWLEHVDVRGVGGYVVAPPSVHQNGEFYLWERQP